MEKKVMWISTSMHEDKRIKKMIKLFGIESIGWLIEIWTLSASKYGDGTLKNDFIKEVKKHLVKTRCNNKGVEGFDTNAFIEYLVDNNILERKNDKFKIVFGLVLFEQPDFN